MSRVLVRQEALFGPWMMHILGGTWFPGRGSIIGLWDDQKGPLAACLYEGSNGASIMLHIATDGTRRWMNREYLWFVFYYPYEQLGINKIIAPIESTNPNCAAFTEHIGFTLEATLKGCSLNGDMLLYTMRKDQCRWLNLRDRYRGQTVSTKAA